jgi:hypothetical protein
VPVASADRGLQAGLDWIGTQHDLPAPAP